MAIIRNGTKLVYCAPDFGSRIWDISGLMDEHRHTFLSSTGARDNLCVLPSHGVVIGVS